MSDFQPDEINNPDNENFVGDMEAINRLNAIINDPDVTIEALRAAAIEAVGGWSECIDGLLA